MKEYIDSAMQIVSLKDLKRAGWVRRGIFHCESVASHIFMTEFFVMNLPKEIEGNRSKILELMNVHDNAESDPSVKDITPHDNVTPEDKAAREKRAMEKFTLDMTNGPRLMALWQEYEDGATKEASVARQLDKLETAFQAMVYENSHGEPLGEFFDYSEARIHHPVLLEMMKEIRSRRPVITDHDWVI